MEWISILFVAFTAWVSMYYFMSSKYYEAIYMILLTIALKIEQWINILEKLLWN